MKNKLNFNFLAFILITIMFVIAIASNDYITIGGTTVGIVLFTIWVLGTLKSTNNQPDLDLGKGDYISDEYTIVMHFNTYRVLMTSEQYSRHIENPKQIISAGEWGSKMYINIFPNDYWLEIDNLNLGPMVSSSVLVYKVSDQ